MVTVDCQDHRAEVVSRTRASRVAGLLAGHRMHLVACAVFVAAWLAPACGDNRGGGGAAMDLPRIRVDTVEDHDGELVVVEGYVVAPAEGVPRLCGALAESHPPQCAGTRMEIVGLELGRLSGTSTNVELPEGERTVWTDAPVTLTGRIDGDRLELVDDVVVDAGIIVDALAGPTCPVETDPPDPACAPRAVPGATIEVRRGDETLSSTTTDSVGVALFIVEAGTYEIVAQPVDGGPTAPGAMEVVVGDTAERLTLDYDTGIR
jgi:hypothetical protein